jgi:hypothetical protein
MLDTGSIHFTIVDGRRKPLSTITQVLVRLLNGARQIDPKWATGGDITVSGIPFTELGGNLGPSCPRPVLGVGGRPSRGSHPSPRRSPRLRSRSLLCWLAPRHPRSHRSLHAQLEADPL